MLWMYMSLMHSSYRKYRVLFLFMGFMITLYWQLYTFITIYRICRKLAVNEVPKPIKTNQNPLVLCTPPFEKSPIQNPSVLCTPPFEKSLFLVDAYFGVGVYFDKYGMWSSFSRIIALWPYAPVGSSSRLPLFLERRPVSWKCLESYRWFARQSWQTASRPAKFHRCERPNSAVVAGLFIFGKMLNIGQKKKNVHRTMLNEYWTLYFL